MKFKIGDRVIVRDAIFFKSRRRNAEGNLNDYEDLIDAKAIINLIQNGLEKIN